ncbi:hypothetical protein AHF37_08547 [Paragonimus kellicotti]|nr:hypothetical protein AHF37_08547 [Paragonimus kellicotti]
MIQFRSENMPYLGIPHLKHMKDFEFYEDLGELEMFRTTNEDYLGSGYDRGHMAAAGNYRFEKPAMSQTFILSNIAPQVCDHFFLRIGYNCLFA